MSLDWKLQRSLANRSHNLMFFLAMSLVLHGAVFLVAVYWGWFMRPHRTPEAPIPVEFIELPANTAVKPPLDAKRRASSNSTGGTHLELPLATGALEVRPKSLSLAHQPSLTRSTASTTQPAQSVQLPQPHQPTPLLSSSPQKTNTSGVTNPADQQNVPRFQGPNPQPSLVQSPRSSQPALPPSVPLTKDALEAGSKTPLPISQPNSTRSKGPNPQPSQPARPSQPALLSSLWSLATGGFEVTKTPANQPNSTQLRVPNPQPSQRHSPPPAPLRHSPLFAGTSKTRPKARLPANRPNITRPKAATPQSNQLHSPQPSRLAASALTGGRWNITSPIAPTPARSKSSPRRPQGQAELLGGTIAMNSHDFMSNRDHLTNADRPSTDFNGADARKDSDMGPYLDRLRQQVTDQWPHQEVNSFKQTIVVFSISRNGQITNMGIFQSSGSIPIDAAALGAVQKAAPFEPLPESFSGDHYPIQFKFTINASGQLDLH